MRLILMIIMLIGMTIPLGGALAQDEAPAPQGDFSSLKRTGSGRVDQVIDGQTLLLKDKKIIRLPALDIPPDDDVAFSAGKHWPRPYRKIPKSSSIKPGAWKPDGSTGWDKILPTLSVKKTDGG